MWDWLSICTFCISLFDSLFYSFKGGRKQLNIGKMSGISNMLVVGHDGCKAVPAKVSDMLNLNNW